MQMGGWANKHAYTTQSQNVSPPTTAHHHWRNAHFKPVHHGIKTGLSVVDLVCHNKQCKIWSNGVSSSSSSEPPSVFFYSFYAPTLRF